MDYFKKCPKCGRYMTPHLQSKFGYVYTLWTCPCGYLVVLPCDTVYFICDKGTKDAHVRTKSILDLLVYDINVIDKDGRYWSVKEEAEKALEEMKKNE